jgi:hypothetical protein
VLKRTWALLLPIPQAAATSLSFIPSGRVASSRMICSAELTVLEVLEVFIICKRLS